MKAIIRTSLTWRLIWIALGTKTEKSVIFSYLIKQQFRPYSTISLGMFFPLKNRFGNYWVKWHKKSVVWEKNKDLQPEES